MWVFMANGPLGAEALSYVFRFGFSEFKYMHMHIVEFAKSTFLDTYFSRKKYFELGPKNLHAYGYSE